MIKKFLKKWILFSSIGLLLFVAFFFLKYYETNVEKLIGSEVYHSIFKSKSKKKGVKTLLLGDSVAKQAYDNYAYNDSLYSLACNQAISVAGHYFLLKYFLDNYTSPEELDIIFLYRPTSFSNDLDQPVTFNYFLKLFYYQNDHEQMTSHVKSQVRKIPLFFLAKYKTIVNSNWSPGYKIGQTSIYDFHISNTSAEYVRLMYDLCKKKQVKSFKMLCTYMSDEVEMSDLKSFLADIERHQLSAQFEGYFDKLVFLDSDLFGDIAHLKTTHIPLYDNYLGL